MKKICKTGILFLLVALCYSSCSRKQFHEEEQHSAGTIAGNDAGNYPIPCGCDFVVTNYASDRIEVYDYLASSWGEPKWHFKPTTEKGWTTAQVAQWWDPNDIKIRKDISALGGDFVMVATGGRMALITNFNGNRVWSVDLGAGANPQSADILPNGNVAVASAGLNWIRVYASSQGANDTTYAQFNLILPHAVLWDPTNQVIWVTGQISGGDNILTALIVGGTPAAPTLVEDLSRRSPLPNSPVRDVSPVVGDPNKLWIAASGGLYLYNKTTKTFTAASGAVNQTNYNSVSNQPSGQIITARTSTGGSPWTTNTIYFYSGSGTQIATRSKTGAAFLKARSLNPNYEFRAEYGFATFNIRSSTSGDVGDRTWANRRPLVKDMINKYDFDIVGVQEARGDQMTNLSSDLPGFLKIGIGVDGNTTSGHNGIFYKKWRYTLLTSGNFWLSPGAPATSTGPSWDAEKKRMCTWGKFKDLYSGKQFYIFNAHFDHVGVTARQESANLMLSKIPGILTANGSAPVVFMGDLNSDQNSAPYTTLKNSALLEDAYEVAGIRYAPTRATGNWWNPDPTWTNRIDHIFPGTEWQVKSHNVLNDNYSGVLPSDHFPVLVEMKLP